MRIAALAFGVLAGLVASLILALGGLDVSASAVAGPDRQAALLRFVLLLIGNAGIFGAALVLASPLAGGIALVVGALAWVGAALLLHHTTDMVLITPPALLLIAAGLAFVAHWRARGQVRIADKRTEEPIAAALAVDEDDEEEPELPARVFKREPEPARKSRRAAPALMDIEPVEDVRERADANDFETEPVAVNAGFFGLGSPQELFDTPPPPLPLQDEDDEDVEDFEPEPEPRPAPPPPRRKRAEPKLVASDGDDWNPRKRRATPPRQRSVFREPDDDEDGEESGFIQLARRASGLLSFVLYGTLIAAAILIVWNLRNGYGGGSSDATVAETKAASSSASSSASAPETAVSSVLPPPPLPPIPSSAEAVPSVPSLVEPPSASSPPPPVRPSSSEAAASSEVSSSPAQRNMLTDLNELGGVVVSPELGGPETQPSEAGATSDAATPPSLPAEPSSSSSSVAPPPAARTPANTPRVSRPPATPRATEDLGM